MLCGASEKKALLVKPRSSYESALRNSSALATGLSAASGVSGGSFPSGGSIINDVRFVSIVVLFANQNSLCSSSVRNALPSNPEGLSNGVPAALFHTPCRSGSPHGVRNVEPVAETAFVAAFGVGACPARRDVDSDRTAVGTHFQFRTLGDEPLTIVGVTMPPWPGEDEAVEVNGMWTPTVKGRSA